MKTFMVKYSVLVVIAAVILLLIRGDFFSLSWPVIAAQAAGLAIVFWSRAAFGRQEFRSSAEPGNGPLVRRGPYRVIRHPIYAGVLLFLWAPILRRPTALYLATGIVVTLVILVRIELEERFLRQRYSEWDDYRACTKKVVPFLY